VRVRTLLLALLVGAPVALAAQQVGNAPERSPFRDILTSEGLSFYVGRYAGNPNDAGTGVRPGLMLGARLDVRIANGFGVYATFAEVRTSRLRIDAGGDTARVMGNVNVRLVAADLGLVLNLTGDKTWRGLAPFVGVSAGIVAPTARLVDPGGYELGTDFSIVPSLGTRLVLSRRLSLRVELRDYYYRYSFPLAYAALPYASDPHHLPINSLSVGDRKWYNNFALMAGVSYGFNF
jgi:hypothetical protein